MSTAQNLKLVDPLDEDHLAEIEKDLRAKKKETELAGRNEQLGQFDVVKKHIELMVIGIIFLSILPGIIAWAKARFGAKPAQSPGA